MKIARSADKDFAAKIRELKADSSLFDAEIEQRTRAILHDVFVRGDDAVLDCTEKFDGAKLTAAQLALTQAELMAASFKADESLRAAVTEAQAKLKAEADSARRAAAEASIYLALSLLIGAFIASVSAALGGHIRDEHI